MTHSGATGVTISSTSAAASYVQVESVQFSTTSLGLAADTDLLTLSDEKLTVAGEVELTTLDVNGDADVSGTFSLSAAVAALTHSGATGVAITSTSGYVEVQDVQDLNVEV